MKKQKENFFYQMENEKINNNYGKFGLTLLFSSLLAFISWTSILLFTNKIIDVVVFFYLFLFSAMLGIIGLIFVIYYIFKINAIQFSKGKIINGIINLIITTIIIFFILIALYLTSSKNPQLQSFILSLFPPIAGIIGAILAIIGVHYGLVIKQKQNICNINLIFNTKIYNNENDIDNNEIIIKNANGDRIITLFLNNISDNSGYFIGIYKLSGCNVNQIGDKLAYQPILPHSINKFTGIKCDYSDEEMIVIYQDIMKNYYCIHLLINTNIVIEKIEKCDFDFLKERVKLTENLDKKFKRKLSKEFNNISDQEYIQNRKDETKPKNTIKKNNFDLILDGNNNIITDQILLQELKKERLKLSKEEKVPAYMILNNQQLVALATYKPKNRLDFISIYGLGEKKYEQYGDCLLTLINNYKGE